jgi:putative ABC transport system permease protein
MMRLYGWLLGLYPASFRIEYGDELRAIFAHRRRDSAGWIGAIALWAEAIGDVVINAARLHAEILRQDVGYTLRTLRRTPAFTITTVLIAALGVGATTAAFSIADHVLLRPLPLADADRLVKLWQSQPERGYTQFEASPPNYRDWKHASRSFTVMAAFSTVSANLSGDVDPVRVDGAWATSDFFETLRAQAALGRVFTPADEADPAASPVVLSDTLWKQQFGADPHVLGRRVLLDEQSHIIVGVMPAGFYFPERETRYWSLLRLIGEDNDDRSNNYLDVVARLAQGVTVDQARAETTVIAADLARAYPRENAKSGITVNRLRDEVGPQARLLLMALVGASLCVLLIACTNLASLLLGRALARQRELAVRAALGAGRERLLRQMLTEGLVLAAIGGFFGLLLASAAGPLFARLVPTSLPIADVPGVDLRVLAVAALITLATGLGFGVVPALRAARHADAVALRYRGQTGAGRRVERLRSALIVAQVSASIVLLVSSGLLIRAVWAVQQRDPGFHTEGILTLRTALPMPKYEATRQRGDFYRRVLSEIAALPGVTSAAYTTALPMVWRGGVWPVTLDGRPENPAESPKASLRFITPRFFDTLGVPLMRGRAFTDADRQDQPFVAVISESFAREYWPGQDPIGRKFRMAFADRVVVGIAGDVRVRGLERVSEPQVYVPYEQAADGSLVYYAPRDLVVRSSQSVAALLPSIRAIVQRVDPRLPISDVRALGDVVDNETTPRRVQVRVLGVFAGVALLLAGVGLHGLLAFAVSTRAREIGVRMALGARGRDVVTMVLRQGLGLALGGALVGVVLAYAAGRAIQALLADISPADLSTFAAAIIFVGIVTLLGSLPPALRASRVDPTRAMRSE